MASYIIDTNIIIDILKNRSDAVTFFKNCQTKPSLSILTISELYGGVRKREEPKLKTFLQAFNIINLNKNIAEKGGFYYRDYNKSHGCDLIDCLIAASTESINATLVTLNTKHFPMFKNVLRPY